MGWRTGGPGGELRELVDGKGEVLKTWTPSEWEAAKAELEAYAIDEANLSKTETARLLDEVTNSFPAKEAAGIEADGSQLMTAARAAGTGLDAGTTAGLDLAGEAGGVLASGVGATVFGGILGAPVAFKLGVDIGNGLDSLFGWPEWEVFKSPEESEEVKKTGTSVEWREKPEPGWYFNTVYEQRYEEEEYLGEGKYKGTGKEVVHVYGTAPLGTPTWTEPVGESHEEKLLSLLCATANVAGSACVLGPPQPEGVPSPGALTGGRESNNSADGLASRPTVSAPGAASAPLFGDSTTEKVIEKTNTFHSEHSEHEASVRKEAEEQEKESKEHPKTPGGLGPPNLPGLHFPNIAPLCHNFPFGVPCWLYQSIANWSGTAAVPSFTIGSFSVGGKSVPGATVNLESLEPVMVKVRPFILLFSVVGLVLLFYSFARGGGPAPGEQTELFDGSDYEV